MDAATPFILPDQSIRPEWIDYNGHLNMSYYMVLFDQCVDAAFEEFGLGPHYAEEKQASFYTLEVHVTYLQELHLDDKVNVTLQVLDFDSKRTHYFEQMHHADKGFLAATMECICMHVDLKTKRSTPFPDDVLAKIAAMREKHKHLPVPPQVGNVIGIKKKG
jgi:acyl-CoA thioester hydrolase